MAKTTMWASPVLLLLVLLVALVTQQAKKVCSSNECAYWASMKLAHWSFDGTYDEQTRAQRGQVIPAWDRAPVGGNINLAWDPSQSWDGSCAGYVRVGNPGYLEVPRVDFHNVTFTFSFFIRLNGKMADRRILFADWSKDNWQFLSFITPDRYVSIWLRNGKQETFVYLTSFNQVQLRQWTHIAFTWDRQSRTATIYLDRGGAGSVFVPYTVIDINLFKSNTYYYQFGSKADTASQDAKDYSPLEADLRDLRVFKGLILAAGESAKPELEQVVSSA